jgi:4'-phosphopantetheinyl transferase
VEWRDRKVYSAGFAGSVCSPVERASLGDEPDQELIWLWTLKEAFAKARGDGLRLAFSRVHALRGTNIAVELDGEALPDWRFGSWTVDGSYRVAAAVENSQNEKVG